MPTPAQIDEQLNHERDAIAQGLKRLRDNTRNLEDKEYADGSISLIGERSDGSGAFLSSIGNVEWNKPHSGHLNVPFVSSVPHEGHRTDANSENNGSPLKFIPQG